MHCIWRWGGLLPLLSRYMYLDFSFCFRYK